MSEAARAEELHRSSPVFVGHDHYCDEGHLLAMHLAGLAGKVTLASVDARVFGDVEDRERSLHEYTGFTEPAWREMKSIRAIVDAHPEALLLARGAGDIVRAHDTRRSAVLLGFEGGKPIERDLGLLHEAYGLGLRVLQLTWAGGNDICDRRDPPACEGLTDFGREAVQEMNRIGVLIDPGHCSRKTFFQVMELSSRPVAFLHGTPRGAIPGAGDLTTISSGPSPGPAAWSACTSSATTCIRAIAGTGGRGRPAAASSARNYDKLHPARDRDGRRLARQMAISRSANGPGHASHARRVPGRSDRRGAHRARLRLPLPHRQDFRRAHGLPASGYLGIPEELCTRQPFDVVDSYDKLVNVTRELCRRGFRDEEIRGILGGNLIRLFRAVIGD